MKNLLKWIRYYYWSIYYYFFPIKWDDWSDFIKVGRIIRPVFKSYILHDKESGYYEVRFTNEPDYSVAHHKDIAVEFFIGSETGKIVGLKIYETLQTNAEAKSSKTTNSTKF